MPASLITPPTGEPLALIDVKAHLRLDTDDEDTILTRLLTSARQHIEGATRRVLMPQTWRAYLDRWPPKRYVLLPVAPVRAVTQVRVFDAAGDASIVAPSAYVLDKARSTPQLVFQPTLLAPTALANGIEIDIEAGYASDGYVPAPLKEAILRLVALWFEHRLDAGSVNLSPMPSIVESLIAPYRRPYP